MIIVFHTRDDASRRHEALEPEHRLSSLLHPAMVLLDPVVQPLPTAVTRKSPKLAISLHVRIAPR
jgi:hypothetical protein